MEAVHGKEAEFTRDEKVKVRKDSTQRDLALKRMREMIYTRGKCEVKG